MKSQEVFPLKDRLSPFQITELEGFKTTKNPTNIIKPINQLILDYDKALKEAEKEIKLLEIIVNDFI